MNSQHLLNPQVVTTDTDADQPTPEGAGQKVTTAGSSNEQWGSSDHLRVHGRQLAKSDCNLSVCHDEMAGNERRKPSTSTDDIVCHTKRINSFANDFECVVPRQSWRVISVRDFGKRKLSGREGSPFSLDHFSTPQHAERPLTCEEEMKDELGKLRYVVFQMHQKWMSEKKLNKHLSEQMKVREKEYKDFIDKMRIRHEDRLNALRDKAVMALGKCAKEKADLEEEIALSKSSRLLERTNLESRIEELQLEIVTNKISSQESEIISKSVTQEPDDNTEKLETIDAAVEVNDDHPVSNALPRPESGQTDQWNDLYKVLYEISIKKLIVLENNRQGRVKEAIGKSLIDYGYLNFFSDLVSSCSHDINSESNFGVPGDSNSILENPPAVRRSSSCPYLADMTDRPPDQRPSSPVLAKTNIPLEAAANISDIDSVLMRAICDKITAPRPMSIPLTTSESKNLCDAICVDASSGSPSPVQESSPSVFSRQKLQYKHVW